MFLPIFPQHGILRAVRVFESPEAFTVRDADHQLAVFECLSNLNFVFHFHHAYSLPQGVGHPPSYRKEFLVERLGVPEGDYA